MKKGGRKAKVIKAKDDDEMKITEAKADDDSEEFIRQEDESV